MLVQLSYMKKEMSISRHSSEPEKAHFTDEFVIVAKLVASVVSFSPLPFECGQAGSLAWMPPVYLASCTCARL